MDTLTLVQLRSALWYDVDTGVFYRRKRVPGPNSGVGNVAGGLDSNGYVSIMVEGHRHPAHRLAWLYMTGKWPTKDIDHKNRVRHDNRFNNLREASVSDNTRNTIVRRNNKVGLKGVHYDKCASKWKAQIAYGGKKRHLGLFPTAELGAEFYDLASQLLYGEFHCK